MPKLPDGWDEHLEFLNTRPAPDGLRAMARTVASGWRVERARRLGGGISTATSAVRLRSRTGKALDVVLKRYRRTGARDEWTRLRFAQSLPVSAPEPLAVDTRGEWFGTEALVMRRLPGRPDVRPRDVTRWMDEIARAQIAIHASSVAKMPAALRTPPYSGGWTWPRNLERSPLVDAAVTKVRRRFRRASARHHVVGHGDPHPGNLLWSRGRISAVLDWQYAGVRSRGHEVAYMRADIAVLLGVAAAERYRRVYESLYGGPVPDLDLWDLVCGLDALRLSPDWVHPYREQGAPLTQQQARRHAVAFLRRATEKAKPGTPA
jgi:aminoglycoside phosphotransferase (APT) family kinase protein